MTITETRNSVAPEAEIPDVATTALIGYARVSTTGQDLAAQLDVLTAAGVPESTMFSDKLSGRAGSDRPGLAEALRYARRGDVLVVAAVDRLGRSVAEVTRTIAELGNRGVTIRALREGIDTATPTGGRWRRSWQAWRNSKPTSVGNAGLLRVKPGSLGGCPRPGRAR